MNKNKIDCAIPRGWLFENKQDFARRFNIDFTDDGFYNRCILKIEQIIGNGCNFDGSMNEILFVIGKRDVECHTQILTCNYSPEFKFKHTKLYSLLISLSNDEHFLQFIESIEHIINFYHKEKDENILKSFNDFASISNKNIRLCYNNKYKFYPSSVEIFDKKLVDDILEFLQPYKKAHKELTEALQAFLKNTYRDAVDKMRLALEVFLKELLKNQKSLENQKEPLNQYLGKYTHQDIKSMFLRILEFYTNFNNDKAKHNSGDFKAYEVEFLFYLVGNFIRLFMQVANDRQEK